MAWDRPGLTRDRLPGVSVADQQACLAAVVLYPGRLLEVAWPVLLQARAQGMLHGVEDWSAARRVVGAAATAVTTVLAGPRASWWQPYDGHWLWASTTPSKTTGLPLGQQHTAPLAG